MITVHRHNKGKQRVVIYSNDHRPCHVHVLGPGGEAVFDLNCPDGPPTLREVDGFSMREINRILDWLPDGLEKLCKEWRRIHGRY